ncbi:MAG TPA: hydroxyphenylacetyl-CoA thioesterase PaaI [Terriglobales bacterium]|nr:hydroxyphenylacetyl-CoA thioesterase PaaI [Terriglobales bacterium]
MSELLARDRASQALGMELLDYGPGRARLRMRITAAMIQGHSTCHGGYVFTLADSAFAAACNSHGYAAVASGCSIEYLRPVVLDDDLIAEASEQALAGRSGVYNVTVSNQHGDTVAIFRGRSRQVSV